MKAFICALVLFAAVTAGCFIGLRITLTDQFYVIVITTAMVFALFVPRRNIRDRAPRRYRSPQLRMPTRHQQSSVSAAGSAGKIDPFCINIAHTFGIFPCRNDIFDHQDRPARFRPGIRSPECRIDQMPIQLFTAGAVCLPRAGKVVVAPGMQCHQKRTRATGTGFLQKCRLH